jgi:signal transduction histidine kinase
MRELVGTVRLYLFQRDAGANLEFRRQVARVSHQGMRALTGGMAVFLGLAVLSQRFLNVETDDLLPARVMIGAIGAGTVSFLLSFLPWSRRHSVLLGCATIYVMTMSMVWSMFLTIAEDPQVPAAYIGEIVFMLTAAVLMLSLHPLHALWLGLALSVNVQIAEWRAVKSGVLLESQTTSPGEHAILIFAVLFVAALAAVSYRRYYMGFLAHQHEIQAAESARKFQSELLLAENAASMGRFAATLSHEINTPLGALMSCSQSLQSIPGKKKDASPQRLVKLDGLSEQLASSIRESAQRLSDVVIRMQRITNLDRAEMLEVDLNELLRDVIAVFDSGKHGEVAVSLEAGDLPKTMARPQQLSAVFTNLIQSGTDDMEGRGTLLIRTEGNPSELLVSLHAAHIVLDPEMVKSRFEPGFQAEGGRMAGSDWSLFSTREMVRRHGGDIMVESSPETGTTLNVRLRVIPIAGSMSGA